MSFEDKEKQLIKPFYTTTELKRWYKISNNKKWLIYTDSSFKDHSRIQNYPNIKKHLDQFKKIITSDNKPYGLHRARKEYFFKDEKIISLRKCDKPTFTYVHDDCYVSETFYIIKSDRINLKYLIGLLNSKIIAFWLRHKGKMQGLNYQIDKQPILSLPLIHTVSTDEKLVINLVNEIIDLVKSDNKYKNNFNLDKILKLEKQIDNIAYKLYGLTEEEIKLIEN